MTTRPELQEREIGELWGRYNFRSSEAYLSQKANLILVVAFSSLEPSENHVGDDKRDDSRSCKDHCRRNEKIKEEYHHDVFSRCEWAHCSL